MVSFKKFTKFTPVIGVLIFIYFIFDIGIDKIANTFSLIPIEIYILSLLLFIPRIILFAYKWQYICRKQKMDFSLIYLMKIFLICIFYGSITPGAFGVHARIFYLKKESNSTTEKCLMNSLINIMIGFTSGLFLALIGSILLFHHFPSIFPIVLSFLILYLIGFFILLKKNISNKILKSFIRYFIPSKYKEFFNHSIDLLYEDIPKIKDLIIPFLLECLIWILVATQVYVISLAFSINVPYHIFILMVSISIVFTGIIPISVGGLGVREGVLIYLLSLYNVDYHIAFVISLSGYLVKSLIPSIIGIPLMSFRKK